MVDLTKRQKQIFAFIGRFVGKNGYPPTVREIGKAIGLHSPSTVHAHLAKLESLGVLRRESPDLRNQRSQARVIPD